MFESVGAWILQFLGQLGFGFDVHVLRPAVLLWELSIVMCPKLFIKVNGILYFRSNINYFIKKRGLSIFVFFIFLMYHIHVNLLE